MTHFLSDNSPQAPCLRNLGRQGPSPDCLFLLCEVRREVAAPQKVLGRPLRPARNRSKVALSLRPCLSCGTGLNSWDQTSVETTRSPT